MEIGQSLSAASLDRLFARNVKKQDVQQFSGLLDQAAQRGGSYKAFLQSLTADELGAVQRANGLASPVNPTTVSEEGAQNLLSQPDGSNRVDLNNDGLVEVGEASMIQFPPVNAPAHVKQTWQETTRDMSEQDRMFLELKMHQQVYGIQVEGFPRKSPLSPAQQWSEAGISAMFDDLQSNLAFRFGMEGWTEHNTMLRDAYARFADALNSPSFAPLMHRFQVFHAAENRWPVRHSRFRLQSKRQCHTETLTAAHTTRLSRRRLSMICISY